MLDTRQAMAPASGDNKQAGEGKRGRGYVRDEGERK